MPSRIKPIAIMQKKMKKTPLNITVFAMALTGMILCTLLEFHISSVWFVLGAGILGLFVFFIRKSNVKGENKR